MKELKLFGPFGNLGYGGMSKEVWQRSMEWRPDAIFQQGTSTDPGPGYLGTGQSYADRLGIKHDLEMMILAALEHHIPLICSMGGGGSDRQLEWNLQIIDEIARERKLRVRAAVISGEVDKEFIKGKIAAEGKVESLDGHPRISEHLTEEDVDAASVIVAQMGYEPIVRALGMDVDVVLTGRASDVALAASLPLKEGFDKGLSFQMAKVLECSGWGIIKEDHFQIVNLNSEEGVARNVSSVISHGVFYERRNPLTPEYFPGGHLDISEAKWEQVDQHTIRGSGGKIVADPYRVKIEGVKMVGYQTICLTGMRDPWLIRRVEDGSFLKLAKETARQKISDARVDEKDYELNYRVYGMNGVMGSLEPQKGITSHELCIVVDSIGKSPDISKLVCMLGRLQIIHLDYPGRLTTAGNVAVPFSPSDIYMGEAYQFNIWHLLPIKEEENYQIFKTRILEFPLSKGGVR